MFNRGVIWKIRILVYFKRRRIKESRLINKINHFTKSTNGAQFRKESVFLSKFGITVFPYSFSLNYSFENIEVFKDKELSYVKYFDRDLHFPSNYDTVKIQKYANQLMIEQDSDSPHRYKTDLFDVEEADVLFDIGSAEGNFSLEHIEKVKKVYLFEINKNWTEPINSTFSPWKSKVSLCNIELGSLDANLSDFISTNDSSIYLKVDVDGSERDILKQIELIFNLGLKIKVAICTYHNSNDASDFENWFNIRGFTTSFSPSYMLFYHDKNFQPPYFRKGVLFAHN